MTLQEKYALLEKIKYEVEQEPALFGEIVNYCNSGIEQRINEERMRAADMETIAISFQSQLNQRYRESTSKWLDNLIKSKLAKWKGKTSFNWEVL